MNCHLLKAFQLCISLKHRNRQFKFPKFINYNYKMVLQCQIYLILPLSCTSANMTDKKINRKFVHFILIVMPINKYIWSCKNWLLMHFDFSAAENWCAKCNRKFGEPPMPLTTLQWNFIMCEANFNIYSYTRYSSICIFGVPGDGDVDVHTRKNRNINCYRHFVHIKNSQLFQNKQFIFHFRYQFHYINKYYLKAVITFCLYLYVSYVYFNYWEFPILFAHK